MTTSTGGGRGSDWWVVEVVVVAHGEGGVGGPAPYHADVEGFGGGAVVDNHDGVVDGDPLGLVDGDGVAEGDVVSHVVGREGGPAALLRVLDGEGPVLAPGQDGPSVAVADPPVAGGGEAPVVAEGHDLIPDPHQVTTCCSAAGFDLPGSDARGSGPGGEGVNGDTVGGAHDDGLAQRPERAATVGGLRRSWRPGLPRGPAHARCSRR